MKTFSAVSIFVLALFGFSCKPENKSIVSSTPELSRSSKITPIFNAAALTGKSPKQVEKILGSITDSWTPTDRSDPGYLMQSYALGKDMTVEFHRNRIKSLVIFFNEQDVDSETAYRLVGLDYAKPKPVGISNITTGEGWIKIYY